MLGERVDPTFIPDTAATTGGQMRPIPVAQGKIVSTVAYGSGILEGEFRAGTGSCSEPSHGRRGVALTRQL
jgi:hypothetical protein